MKERALHSIMVLVLVLGMTLTLATPVGAATVVFTGNVPADFDPLVHPGVLIIPDPQPQDCNVTGLGIPSGWDMVDLRLLYDAATDTLYVGINTAVIAGDADNDGNPGLMTRLPSGNDPPDLGGTETINVYFDLDKDGTLVAPDFDVIAGVPVGLETKDINAFTVATWVSGGNRFSPGHYYGTNLGGHNGGHYASPSATAPDFEFTITHWSTLPGDLGLTDPSVGGFIMWAMMGSEEDNGIGEDYLVYEQNPHTIATITANATIVKSGGSVSLNISEANLPVGPYSMNLTNPQVGVSPPLSGGLSTLTKLTPGFVAASDADSDGILDVGENWTWTNILSGPIAGPTTFVARGSGTAPGDFPVNNITDPLEQVNVRVDTFNPNICINKTVDCNNDGVFKDVDLGYAGDTAHWKVVVWNCGDSNLTNVTVTDTNGHNFGAPFNLPAGAAPVEFNYNTVVNVNTTNNATVTATDLAGGTVSAWDIATNNVITSNICINKTVDCNNDGVFKDVDVGYAGDTAHWKVVVWNCGGSNLTNVTVTDTNGHNFGAPFNLPAGAAPVEFNYNTVVNVNTTNNATVTATDLLGGTVSAWDIATNNVITPKLCIDKTVDCNGDGFFHDEETYTADNATWKVVVTNCGSAPVYNITVTDTNGHNFGAPFDLLNNGNHKDFTYTTVISVTTTNRATAVGKDAIGGVVGPVSDSATNRIVGMGCLQICKFEDANVNGMWDPGEEYLPDWRFEVTGPDNFDTWVTTGPEGCVVLSGLDSGTYTVTEELEAGWYNTRPGGDPPYEQEVIVETGLDCARVEFGNREEIKDIPPMVPTMNEWGIIAMITVFAGLLVWTVRRKRLAS